MQDVWNIFVNKESEIAVGMLENVRKKCISFNDFEKGGEKFSSLKLN